MKILRQHDSFDVNSGMSLYTIQLEIPPSKRIINFNFESGSAKFYLSLPKIGIMASFYKTPDANIWSYEQFGFFISEDKKTHRIPFPNINVFAIDSCNSHYGKYVPQILSVTNKDEYSEKICQQFLQTAFDLDSGSNAKQLVNLHVQNKEEKHGCRVYFNHDDILLNFYKSWEDKTKTVKNYDCLKDKNLFKDFYKNLNFDFPFAASSQSRTIHRIKSLIAITQYGYKPDFDFFKQNLEIQNTFFSSQFNNWGS